MQLLWMTVVLGSVMFVTDVEAQNCVNDASCNGNGICPNPNNDVCSCTGGFIGNGCANPPICTAGSTACRNGGTCITSGNPFVCSCAPGFSGLTCENACTVDADCNNGGTCANDNTCTCPAGFTGGRCENGTGRATILGTTLLLSFFISVSV